MLKSSLEGSQRSRTLSINVLILTICSAQTDKTDDKRYDLEVKTQKTAKEIVELETRIKGIKGKFFYNLVHIPVLGN